MDTPIKLVGLIFFGRSIGSLIGKSLSNGFPRLRKGYGIMALSLIVLMVLQSVFPLASSLQAAVCIMLSLGAAYGLFYEGENPHEWI